MKHYVRGTLAALVAPAAAGAMFMASPGDGGCRHDGGPGGCTAVSCLDE